MPMSDEFDRTPRAVDPSAAAAGDAASDTQADAAFERALRHAFVRVDAPESLAKFLATAAEAEAARQKSGQRVLWFRPRTGGKVLVMSPAWTRWVGSAVAAVLVLGSFGALETLHQRNLRRQAEAQREFAAAEQITNHALAHAREQVARAGFSLEP